MVKHLSVSLLVVLSAASVLSAAGNTNVREREYVYQYSDTVKAMPEDSFVLCEGCKVDALQKLPLPFVGLKAVQSNPGPLNVAHWSNQQQQQMAAVMDSAAGGKDMEPLQEFVAGKAKEAEVAGGLLGTVLFKFDSDVLTKSEKAKLDQVAASLPDGVELVVTGYTCSLGVKSYNQQLSEKRAKAVAAYLKSRKVKISDVEAKGECCPVSKTDKKLNRRVELEKKGGK